MLKIRCRCFSDFATKIWEKELKEAETMGPVSGDDNESLPPLFYCSKETFRQLLHRLAYVYGKLDTRAVVLKEERIVRMRHKYLNRIRQNDAAGSAGHPVVYVEETWSEFLFVICYLVYFPYFILYLVVNAVF